MSVSLTINTSAASGGTPSTSRRRLSVDERRPQAQRTITLREIHFTRSVGANV